MPDFFFRTEDIRPEDVLDFFVETHRDREIITALKARNPVILTGSRGVGKSFLLRVAEAELLGEPESRVLPVYVSFSRSSLINTTDPQQFQHWMLARICARVLRTLESRGLAITPTRSVRILSGGASPATSRSQSAIEQLVTMYEESWKGDPVDIPHSSIPSIEEFRDAIEDICTEIKFDRMVILIDEAAHILLPEQQRHFFYVVPGFAIAISGLQGSSLSRGHCLWRHVPAIA